ncbi:MAG TPA: hypothetical protein VGL10_04135 [Gammaproteobacteria bacterium]
MQNISDLKIISIDESRSPKLRKEPYIDLYFKLSHKAPKDWCQDFNMLFTNYEYSVKIDVNTGLYIETWVRDMGEIAKHLDVLKKNVTECSARYIQKAKDLEAALLNANNAIKDAPGAQDILNKVIAGLNFD